MNTGFAALRPLFLALHADVRLALHELDAAITLLSEALALAEASGERSYLAELYRRQGEALLLRGDPRQGEVALLRAVAVAHHQQARLFELRAALGLTRLWQAQDIHGLLEPIHGWFSEGRDTPERYEAAQLLAALPL